MEGAAEKVLSKGPLTRSLVGILKTFQQGHDSAVNDVLAKAPCDKEYAKLLVSGATHSPLQNALQSFADIFARPRHELPHLASVTGGLALGREQREQKEDLARAGSPFGDYYLDSGAAKSGGPAIANLIASALDDSERSVSALMEEVFGDELVNAVIAQESGGKAQAVLPKGARGLMQRMPAAGREIARELGIKEYDLNDPATNERFGRYYLEKMLRRDLSCVCEASIPFSIQVADVFS